MAEITIAPEIQAVLDDDEENTKKSCIEVCFPLPHTQSTMTSNRLGLSTLAFDYILKLFAVLEIVWICVAIGVAHNKSAVITFTCNADFGYNADYYHSFDYRCTQRGLFYISAAVISEPILSVAMLTWAIWFSASVARTMSNTYIYVQIYTAICLSLVSVSVNTLAGLVAQSLYVYTLLAVFVVCLCPACSPDFLAAGIFVCILATLSAILPIASTLVAPPTDYSLPLAVKLSMIFCTIELVFVSSWWAIVRFFSISYTRNLWTYTIISTILRYFIRGCIYTSL